VTVVVLGKCFSLQGEITGALAGALIGGAGVILGGSLEAAERRRAAARDEEILRSKLKTLIAAELVSVALGYVTAHRFISGSLDALQHGAPAEPTTDLSEYGPTPLSWATALLSESLVLSERQLDILVTLGTNMAMTRLALREVGTGARPFNMLSAQRLKDGITHDMDILAQASKNLRLLGGLSSKVSSRNWLPLCCGGSSKRSLRPKLVSAATLCVDPRGSRPNLSNLQNSGEPTVAEPTLRQVHNAEPKPRTSGVAAPLLSRSNDARLHGGGGQQSRQGFQGQDGARSGRRGVRRQNQSSADDAQRQSPQAHRGQVTRIPCRDARRP
jgi:hypothetical protein